MDGVFQWIKNITCYLIFVRLLFHLMPTGKYEPYMKLFFGAVFILLVITPLTGEFPLEGRLAHAYAQIRFTQEQEEFQQKLWGMEAARTKQMMKQYEEAVAQEIRTMAREEGFSCFSAGAEIEEREQEENFGQVTKIYLVIGTEKGKETKAEEKADEQEEKGGAREDNRRKEKTENEQEADRMVSIEEVKIVVGEENWDEQGTARQDVQARFGEENPKEMGNEREAVHEFRRKVAEIYGLEEKAVQITWQND